MNFFCRWLHQANPDLGLVISAWLRRTDWVLNTELLAGLRPFATSPELHKQWMSVKRKNKVSEKIFNVNLSQKIFFKETNSTKNLPYKKNCEKKNYPPIL